MKKIWLIPAVTLLTLSTAFAAGEECAVPGILVLEDPAGDSGSSPQDAATIPIPAPSVDIRSLHMAEPAGLPGKLVFTYKIESLSTVPPSVGYIVRLSTDVTPATGDDDYFVAMLTGPGGSASFVHGTTGFVDPAPPRFLKIAGELDPASNFNADGTITLVLDKSAIPGLDAGMFVFNILPTVRVLTPTADAADTATNADNATILDQVAGSGFYDVSADGCAGKSGLQQVLAGAWSPFALLLLLLPALRRRSVR